MAPLPASDAAGPIVEVDPRGPVPAIDAGSAGCVVLTAPLEQVADPLPVLRAARGWLAPGGVLVCTVGNFTDQRGLVQLLRSDPQLAARSASAARASPGSTGYATAYKVLLEAGWSPELVEVEADEPDAGAARGGRPAPRAPARPPDARRPPPRRPALRVRPPDRWRTVEDTRAPTWRADHLRGLRERRRPAPPQPARLAVPRRGVAARAAPLPGHGQRGGGAQQRHPRGVSHDLVVLVQQDVYLPSWWPARLRRQWAAAAPVDEPPAIGGPVGRALPRRRADPRRALRSTGTRSSARTMRCPPRSTASTRCSWSCRRRATCASTPPSVGTSTARTSRCRPTPQGGGWSRSTSRATTTRCCRPSAAATTTPSRCWPRSGRASCRSSRTPPRSTRTPGRCAPSPSSRRCARRRTPPTS